MACNYQSPEIRWLLSQRTFVRERASLLRATAFWTALASQPLDQFGYDLAPVPAFLLTLGSLVFAGPLLLPPLLGSAVAIAAMPGSAVRRALSASIALTVAAPISIPFAVAFAAFGRGSALASDPAIAIGITEIAGLLLLGCCGVVAVISSGPGNRLVCMVGRFSANRSVALVWTVASFGLPPLLDVYVAACFIPLLARPFFAKFIAPFARLVLWGRAIPGC